MPSTFGSLTEELHCAASDLVGVFPRHAVPAALDHLDPDVGNTALELLAKLQIVEVLPDQQQCRTGYRRQLLREWEEAKRGQSLPTITARSEERRVGKARSD